MATISNLKYQAQTVAASTNSDEVKDLAKTVADLCRRVAEIERTANDARKDAKHAKRKYDGLNRRQ